VHATTVVDAVSAAGSPEADGSVAERPGAVCAVLTADCLPVLLCDQRGTVVAALHAGWRGLAGGIIEAGVARMQRPPPEIIAWLGPAIGPDAFEVGEEVRAAFIGHDDGARRCFRANGDGRWLADIYALAATRLSALGVEAVYGGGYCTLRDAESFFSYRRDKQCGRMASLIWLEQKR
jgi:YfiH family protein